MDAWQRTAADYFLARLATCVVRVVWSSWVNAVMDHSIMMVPHDCPNWYGEERFNARHSRYHPPADESLIPLLAGAFTRTYATERGGEEV